MNNPAMAFHERRLTKFLILFDNSNLLYFPGQFLSGRVIVELHDEMAITGQLQSPLLVLNRTNFFCPYAPPKISFTVRRILLQSRYKFLDKATFI
jgi:hypothetical protein